MDLAVVSSGSTKQTSFAKVFLSQYILWCASCTAQIQCSALCSVSSKKTALQQIMFSPHSRNKVVKMHQVKAINFLPHICLKYSAFNSKEAYLLNFCNISTTRSIEIVLRGGPPLKLGGPPLDFIKIHPNKQGPPLKFNNIQPLKRVCLQNSSTKWGRPLDFIHIDIKTYFYKSSDVYC